MRSRLSDPGADPITEPLMAVLPPFQSGSNSLSRSRTSRHPLSRTEQRGGVTGEGLGWRREVGDGGSPGGLLAGARRRRKAHPPRRPGVPAPTLALSSLFSPPRNRSIPTPSQELPCLLFLSICPSPPFPPFPLHVKVSLIPTSLSPRQFCISSGQRRFERSSPPAWRCQVILQPSLPILSAPCSYRFPFSGPLARRLCLDDILLFTVFEHL